MVEPLSLSFQVFTAKLFGVSMAVFMTRSA